METINFLITGVGGQGTVLASEIMAAVGLAADYDVKKSDLLGLSVRREPPVPEARTEAYYRKRPCPEIIGDAAEILERFISENPVPSEEGKHRV